MKGQVSVELLVVIAFILVLFIPLLVISYFKVVENNDQLVLIQTQISASRIANLGNSVARMGENSSIITDVYIPPHVKTVNFKSVGGGGEVIFVLSSKEGDTEVVAVTDFPLEVDQNLNIEQEGLYRIEILSKEEKIYLRSYP
ncbi:hypothetical protein JXB01_01740 [Candidatus Micrarchaeota archaeon]|nr:hypothetical protein [Candidatus Micrarchaeota archaeon]